MTFYSHSRKLEDGTHIGTKLLQDHLNGVLQNAQNKFCRIVELGPIEDLEILLNTLAKMHDFGKFTKYFQDYLLQKPDTDTLLKQHAKMGALLAYNVIKGRDQKLAVIAFYLILKHHTNLSSVGKLTDVLQENTQKIFQIQKNSIIESLGNIQLETGIDDLESLLTYPDEREIRIFVKTWTRKEINSDIKDYFFINYFFSLLIEGDKLDASNTSFYNPVPLPTSSVDERYGNPLFTDDPENLNAMNNNELRNHCRASVIKNLDSSNILDHYLFTLTAPTGIGKTMTALDYALKLKEKIRSTLNYEATIIYALPFINIIEQAIEEYKSTLPATAKIFGHYQLADVFGPADNNNDAVNYHQKLMELDTWQADIIITSFVQFFETLIGNRNKLLKKFNHYAGAIIILDEVQTLRLDQMPLIGAALFYLAKFLKSRIILMTATKPKILELAQQEILNDENEVCSALELLPDFQKVFQSFNRTKIAPLLNFELDSESCSSDFVKKVFAEKWNPNQSCIIVCNTVKRSIEIYDEIISFIKEKNNSNKVFYLSTNIVPSHRLGRINKIKSLLDDKVAPILVSTQVVEAGVDLDFDIGFRDIGPVDSIIQVAGRINRNNNPEKAASPLYIVDFGDAKKIYGSMTYEQARQVLKDKAVIPEKEYLELISKYFDNISDRSSFAGYRKIFKSMKCLRYDSEDISENSVSSFKIIEESHNTSTVFVELGSEESDLVDKYRMKIDGELSKEEWDRQYKLSFQQRVIAVPSTLTSELDVLDENSGNLKIIQNSFLSHYYNLQTGFIRNQQDRESVFMF